MLYSYPPTPENFDQSVLQPHTRFKKTIRPAIFGIVLFIGVYLLFLATAILLLPASVYALVAIVSKAPHLYTLGAGIGLIIMAGLLVFFFIKFLFKINRAGTSDLMEISATDHPELVSFINRVADECGTQHPKRIFLSEEVNAAVTYDSSFLSLFLPVRKNLIIGLGLVNSVNLSELKAILAHEFGHFSQKSMRVGSYVYTANRVLYNLLGDDDGFRNLLQNWASVWWGFYVLALATIKVVQGCRFVLFKIYEVMNVRYMALSREMEFNADLMAASVAGANHLPSSLYRIEMAVNCFNEMTHDLDIHVKLNRKAGNVFLLHRIYMAETAKRLYIAERNGLPVVDSSLYRFWPQQRIEINKQWESHPSTLEREKHLLPYPATPVNEQTAWILFREPEQLQRELTEKIYSRVRFEQTPETISTDAYKIWLDQENQKLVTPAFFRNYYYYHEPQAPTEKVPVPENIQELFSDEHATRCTRIKGLNTDIELAEMIRDKKIQVKTFDFDGIKYTRKAINTVIAKLHTELQEEKRLLEAHDNRIAAYFLHHAALAGIENEIETAYNTLKQLRTLGEETATAAHAYGASMNPLFYGQLTFEQVEEIIRQIKPAEAKFKTALNQLMTAPGFIPEVLDQDFKKLEKFYSSNLQYFNGNSLLDDIIELGYTAVPIAINMAQKSFHTTKNKLLQKQLSLIGVAA